MSGGREGSTGTRLEMDAPQDAVCIERAEVEAVVRDVDDLIKGCGNTLHEVFASVPVFYEQNTRLCVAISRNLLTLHETLPSKSHARRSWLVSHIFVFRATFFLSVRPGRFCLLFEPLLGGFCEGG